MSRRPRSRWCVRGSAGGFTLIELLVAAALLAVLAVLSWRGLETVLAARQRIVAASADLRALTSAWAQLDDDLRRAWSVRGLPLGAPSVAFVVVGQDANLSVHLLREAGAPTEPVRVQQVVWRVQDGRLERGFGPGRSPQEWATAAPTAAARATPLTWQTLVADVQAWTLQAWLSDQTGWLPAAALQGRLSASAAVSDATPVSAVTGLWVQLVRTDRRTVDRVLSVRD